MARRDTYFSDLLATTEEIEDSNLQSKEKTPTPKPETPKPTEITPIKEESPTPKPETPKPTEQKPEQNKGCCLVM